MLETSTIIFMVLILGYTWGALFLLLRKAYAKEKQKIYEERKSLT